MSSWWKSFSILWSSVSFTLQKTVTFMRSYLVIIDLSACIGNICEYHQMLQLIISLSRIVKYVTIIMKYLIMENFSSYSNLWIIFQYSISTNELQNMKIIQLTERTYHLFSEYFIQQIDSHSSQWLLEIPKIDHIVCHEVSTENTNII